MQPSVSIPVPDRPTESVQAASLSCRGWRIANVPHWSGVLMFNSDCNLFHSQSSRCSAQASVWSTRGARESVGSKQGPSVHHLQHLPQRSFNLFYSTTPLDSTDLSDPLASNEMTELISLLRLKDKPSSEDLQESCSVIKREWGQKGINFSQVVFWFRRQLLLNPAEHW